MHLQTCPLKVINYLQIVKVCPTPSTTRYNVSRPQPISPVSVSTLHPTTAPTLPSSMAETGKEFPDPEHWVQNSTNLLVQLRWHTHLILALWRRRRVDLCGLEALLIHVGSPGQLESRSKTLSQKFYFAS